VPRDGVLLAYGPLFLLGALLMSVTGGRAEAASPTRDEMVLRRDWVEANFVAAPPKAEFRVYKYPADYPGLAGRGLMPRKPIVRP